MQYLGKQMLNIFILFNLDLMEKTTFFFDIKRVNIKNKFKWQKN